MNRPADSAGVGPVPGFPDELPQLLGQLGALRTPIERSADARVLLLDLETAYEQLRVADQQIHAQQEEIRRLSESHQLMRWQHQRMLGMVPVAVLTTDLTGVIGSANAAAAGVLGISVSHLLRKPIFGFIAPADRPELRRQCLGLVHGARIRRAATLVGRQGRSVTVEVHAVLGEGEAQEISWMMLLPGQDPATFDVALPAALVQLASLSLAAVEVVGVLRQATTVCQAALGDRVTVSLNFGPPSAPTAVSSSGQQAQAADGAQLSLEEGPCVTAFEQRRTVVTSDVRTDVRWPRFAADPRVRDTGGVIAVPMTVGGEPLGVLGVYGEVGSPPDGRLLESAELLAAAVAAVLYEMTVRHELELTAADMERALASRATIDQAKGMIMSDRGCSAEEAFDHLVDLSSKQHLKLRDIAQQIVDQRSGARPPRSAHSSAQSGRDGS